jgi:hypothetical protein
MQYRDALIALIAFCVKEQQREPENADFQVIQSSRKGLGRLHGGAQRQGHDRRWRAIDTALQRITHRMITEDDIL